MGWIKKNNQFNVMIRTLQQLCRSLPFPPIALILAGLFSESELMRRTITGKLMLSISPVRVPSTEHLSISQYEVVATTSFFLSTKLWQQLRIEQWSCCHNFMFQYKTE